MDVAKELDHATRLREATPGRPEDGPYPAIFALAATFGGWWIGHRLGWW